MTIEEAIKEKDRISEEYRNYRASAEKRIEQLLKDRKAMVGILLEDIGRIEELEKELSKYK